MAAHAPITESQLEANRENAQASTGPRTPEGKRRSSLNAVKLGIFSQTLILPGEDGQIYVNLHNAFVADLRPIGAVEEKLVESLAQTQWRLDRCHSREAAIFAHAHGEAEPRDTTVLEGQIYLQHMAAMEALNRQTVRLQKLVSGLLKQIAEIQKERRRRDAELMQAAIEVSNYFKERNLPFHPEEHGFVFPVEEIRLYADRHLARQFARDAARDHAHALAYVRSTGSGA